MALKPPEVVDLPPPPWRLGLQLAINRFRWGLTTRIIDGMGQPAGGIAAAMITGHDYSISQDSTNQMRNAAFRCMRGCAAEIFERVGEGAVATLPTERL